MLIKEIEITALEMLTVSPAEKIMSMSPNFPVLFGYEEQEMIGMSISVISPGLVLCEGKHFVNCIHKDGSHFFVYVEIESFHSADFEECYRGIVKRMAPQKAAKKYLLMPSEDRIMNSTVLGWYEITEKVLGEGYFGSVRIATHRLTGVHVAIKTLRRKQYEESMMPFPPREIDLLLKLRHPNIYRFFHSISTDDAVYMICEVVSGGELFDYASQHGKLDEAECRVIMRQIICAVDYMHNMGVCHRDLKLENILLDANGRIKIIDFGFGNFFEADSMLTTFCGSPDYAAPESWLGKPHCGPKLDIWGLGVIMYVLLTGCIPFNSCKHIIEIDYTWPVGQFSCEVVDLVKRIFKPADERYTMEEILNHSWVTNGNKKWHKSFAPVSGQIKVLNERILLHMQVHLGLARGDVERAVLNGEHNQLSTTYALLEFYMEKSPLPKSGSGVIESESGQKSLTESPRSSPQSLRNSTRESQKQCIIF